MLKKIFRFYWEGFQSMTVGKKLWAIILLKLFIMFVILKMFFFQDFMETHFETDQQRSEYILETLTK